MIHCRYVCDRLVREWVSFFAFALNRLNAAVYATNEPTAMSRVLVISASGSDLSSRPTNLLRADCWVCVKSRHRTTCRNLGDEKFINLFGWERPWYFYSWIIKLMFSWMIKAIERDRTLSGNSFSLPQLVWRSILRAFVGDWLLLRAMPWLLYFHFILST